MANPTTNYSFAMPTNVDLVKDLPADFEVFGQAVDTKLKALNPSTTLGDIEYRSSTADTNTRLGIGSTGQVLAVSGGVPAWTTPASAAPTSAGASVLTKQTTTSASFTDLTTAGPAVTLTTGTKALVMWSHVVDNATDGRGTYVSFAVSGATTLAASSDYQTDLTGSAANRPYVTNSRQVLLTGLTAGSNTFTLKYATESSSTGSFSKRYITVIDMGS